MPLLRYAINSVAEIVYHLKNVQMLLEDSWDCKFTVTKTLLQICIKEVNQSIS